ncbi:hypothetical protein MBANPS3_011982 [Mucor bainieri]
MSRKQVIHTDGACTNNGRAGAQAGYGVYWGDGDHRNVSAKLSGPQTNQRAEAQAVLTALKQTAGSRDTVEIRTDSRYVERAVNEWSHNWENNGWKNSSGQPVANQDLIREIIYHKESRPGHTEITHVRGHAGNYGNEQADALARNGASSGYSNGSNYGNNGYRNNNNYYSNDDYYYDD